MILLADDDGPDPQTLRSVLASNQPRTPFGSSSIQLAESGCYRCPCLAAPSAFKAAPDARLVRSPLPLRANKKVPSFRLSDRLEPARLTRTACAEGRDRTAITT